MGPWHVRSGCLAHTTPRGLPRMVRGPRCSDGSRPDQGRRAIRNFTNLRHLNKAKIVNTLTNASAAPAFGTAGSANTKPLSVSVNLATDQSPPVRIRRRSYGAVPTVEGGEHCRMRLRRPAIARPAAKTGTVQSFARRCRLLQTPTIKTP